MKSQKKQALSILLALSLSVSAAAQWPHVIEAKNGAVITVYQPQPEKLTGDKLNGRSAFSVKEMAGNDLVFGVFWYTATVVTNRDTRTVAMEGITINSVKLPGITDSVKITQLKRLLEAEIPKWGLTGSLDELTSTIEEEQSVASIDLKNDPPVIHYASQPTTLVVMDGEPRLQDDKDLKMKRVINTPFLLVLNPSDNKYYLSGNELWYVSGSMTEGFKPAPSPLPKSIQTLDQQLKKQQKEKATAPDASPPAILVSTTPAELIQTKGAADYASIAGTNLLYANNSEDDIFKSIDDQKFYVLLSGRWFAAPKLEGPWTYIASDKLPPDFAKIPAGSEKDNVLASVAGTQASEEAVRDAQVPQTAKVDRKTATCTVTYDGEPKFEKIEGTSLDLAMNTSSTVIKEGSKYYCVDKGVWFVSSAAKGPWKVSDERPKDVDAIPAKSPAYNTKYVYVYESTPEVVYVGYTPGYMGCYVYGPTVVYGTGFYYTSWYGPYYYPRPATFGYSMHYNPWTGWSMGFHYSTFHIYGGGYWGPPIYRPPYYPPYHGGIYGGRGPTYIHNDININIDRSNNIYNNRKDVSTRDVKRGQNNPSASTRDQNRGRQPQAGQQPAGGPRANSNVYSDRNGNVYQRNENGNWNQRDGNSWKQTQQPSNLDRQHQNRERSTQRNSSFEQMNRGGNMGGNAGRSGGGRMGGGGGRRR